MSTPADAQSKLETFNIAMRTEERKLIERAAKAAGKGFDQFVVDSLLQAAEDALFDQPRIVATPATYVEFLERLDMPATPNERLLQTMQTLAPWDKK